MTVAGRTLRRATWRILPVVLGGLGYVAVLKTDFLGALAVPLDGGARWRGRRGEQDLARCCRHDRIDGAGQRRASHARPTNALETCPGDAAVHPGQPLGGRGRLWRHVLRCRAAQQFRETAVGDRARGARDPERLGSILVDQADSVVGCLIPLRLLYGSTGGELLTAFALGLTIHIAIDAARV